ncbi:hypothetical protein CXF68_20290 [Tenacibaculum sp. Bg11-29]|uniref:hypothetical protein n=1 Tax=Tenacibaculum sp. Bg11-29 TaxID=2058306 RepID=UPI000C34487F|nr:hypothetical protein [Tenacibaculum sp. Bg11-29]PKH52894.1 hypothetical protein CXF68_20290 [Tenacibaculum sp. Bg11-29]
MNFKYNTSDLYNATSGGLDILHKHFPDCVGCETSGSNKFKFRANEKSASASLFKKDDKWLVVDFGDKTYDAVSAVIYKTGLPFLEVLKKLYAEFNVNGVSVSYAANIDFKHNKDNLANTYFNITTKKYDSLESIGRFVNPIIAKEFNFYEVASYQKITKKDGKLMTTSSNDNYPIFAYSNDLKKWAKTYKPAEFKHKNKEGKTVNFKHGYLGKKDNEYIHGLDRILKQVDEKEIISLYDDLTRTYNSTSKKDILSEIKELQVKNIIICSGGSDGLNLASISDDYYPIWLNSEGQQLTYEQYSRLSKLCINFYNLPDLDNAGKKYAFALANKYWNLKTIWLPASKMGQNGKDFRDWLKYYTNANRNAIKRSFENLLRIALKCNFIDYNDKSILKINLANLHYFLNTNNFYTYKQDLNIQDKNNEDTSFVVRIEDYKVSVPETTEIRKFCIEYLKDKGACLDKINLIKKSRAFSVNELKNIDGVSINFKNCSADNQLFYFNNGIVNITKDAVSFSAQNTSNRYVWSHKVVNKNFVVQKNYFNYYKDSSGRNRVKIEDTSCDFMAYLINGSRVHWRKELEEPFDTVQEQEKYRKDHLFTLNGKNLTEEEQITQEQHFFNKCFAFGYLIHRYKREDFAKFVYIMDDAIKGSDDEANGGTGKSLGIRGLKELLNIFTVDGKDDDISSNKHLLGGLQKEHDVINIEDGKKGGAFDFFYNKITGETNINPKGKQGYSLSFADSPKFVGTFNYGLNKNRGSDLRRLFFVSFSDYYHAHTDNFNNERKVSDDFGYSFFQDWSDEQYNKFYNFLMQCCQLYLANVRNEFIAPMDNIKLNNLKAQIGDNCMEWATEYFSDDSRFNTNLLRSELYLNYESTVGKKSAIGVGKFKKAVEMYCKMEDYIFNPKRLRDSQGRIMINEVDLTSQKRVKKEHFYIERKETQQEQQENAITQNIDTDDLEF